MRLTWTKELDEKLIAMRLEGKTFDAIAKEFNLSRSAISGRLFRLKVPSMKASKPKPVIWKPKARHVGELSKEQCKWPIGNVGEPDFHFCPELRLEGKPYCPSHQKIAYVGVPNGGRGNSNKSASARLFNTPRCR
jgi:hypothetical protein